MKNNGDRWETLDIQDPGISFQEAINIKSRVFCVKCGRVAFIADGKYQCLGGHWMHYAGGNKTPSMDAPISWNAAQIVDPGFKIVEIEGVYCITCGRSAFQIGDENRYECNVGHVMDYNNADKE